MTRADGERRPHRRPSALHPRAAAFTDDARSIERRVGLLFAATGIVLILLMGVLGLIMRLTQATVIDLSPAWFYRLMTLHGDGDDHRRPDRGDGRALVRAARERAATAGAHARKLCADRRRRRMRAGGDADRRLRGGLDVPASARVLPGRPVAGLVGESVLRRHAAGRQRLLRLLHRRPQANHEHLRRPVRRARLALPTRTRAGGAASVGDRRDRCRVRRAARDVCGDDDGPRTARPHIRQQRRLRLAGLEEPRLLLRAHDRQPAHLPRSRRRLRAAAPLRGPSLRGNEGLHRRLGRRACPDRHRLLAPPVYGLRPAALGRDRLRDQLVRLRASSRGDHRSTR